MLNIYATNTYADGAQYVNSLLAKVNKKALNVRHIVLVPDRASMSAEQAMLKQLGGSLNCEVLTVRRYASRLLPHYGYLSKQSALMALTGVIEQLKDSFTCFKKGVSNYGFVCNAYELICQMKYARITPEMLQCEGLPPALQGKLNDMRLLYEGYQQYLSGGFVDSATKLEKLIEALSEEPSVKNTYYYFYDFESLTKQELAIIAQLARRSPCVTVACTFSNQPFHKHLFLNDVYDSLRSLAQEEGIECRVQTNYNYKSEFTRHLGEYLYTYRTAKCIPIKDNSVHLYKLANIEQEVTALACHINQHVRDGGRYGDYYCITSDLASYRATITRIFNRYNIPFFTDEKENLADHPVGQYIVDYLTMRKNGNRREDVFNFVKNVLFDGGKELFAFENYCLKYNVGYDYSHFELGNDDTSIDFESAEKVRIKLQSIITRYQLNSVDLGRNYAAVVSEFIEQEQLQQKCQLLAQQCIANGIERYAKVTAQAIDKLRQTIDEFLLVAGERAITLEDFIKMLAVGLQAKSVSVLPLVNDCVVVTNMDKARKHDLCNLALLGAKAGVMPMVKKDSALLTEKNIATLSEKGIYLDCSVKTENKRERFSLYQLLLETDNLFVSSPCGASEAVSVASDFFTTLTQLFVVNGNAIQVKVQPPQRVYTYKNGLYKSVLLEGRQRTNSLINATDYNLLMQKYAQQIKLYNYPPMVDQITKGEALFLNDEETSISKVEKFYSCPYSHYFQYGLRLRKREEAKLDARLFGNILHATLEKYVQRMNVDEDDKTTAELVMKCYEEVMSEDYYRTIAQEASQYTTIKLLKKECVAIAKALKQQLLNSRFVPIATEWQFGGKGSSAYVIPFGNKHLKVKGIVDRIDEHSDMFYCIDYKSGSGEFNENSMFMGQKIQLPLYLCVVAEQKGLKPVGFYYMPLSNTFQKSGASKHTFEGRTLGERDVATLIDTRLLTQSKSSALGIEVKSITKDKDSEPTYLVKGRKSVSQKELEAEMNFARFLVAKAGYLMAKGYIKPSPFDYGMQSTCGYCDYADGCNASDIYGDIVRDKAKGKKAEDIVNFMQTATDEKGNFKEEAFMQVMCNEAAEVEEDE